MNTLLDRQSVRQLKQRITYSYQLQPPEREGMIAYIMHRLVVAGYHGGMLFEAGAVEKLHQASRGMPRLINILCHKALMVAYGQGQRSVSLAFMQMAIRDTEDAQLSARRGYWWQRFVAGFALAAVLISISSYVVHAMV